MHHRTLAGVCWLWLATLSGGYRVSLYSREQLNSPRLPMAYDHPSITWEQPLKMVAIMIMIPSLFSACLFWKTEWRMCHAYPAVSHNYRAQGFFSINGMDLKAGLGIMTSNRVMLRSGLNCSSGLDQYFRQGTTRPSQRGSAQFWPGCMLRMYFTRHAPSNGYMHPPDKLALVL